MAEKGGEESGWKEDSGEMRFEKVDMRQLKEMMGDSMIMVENLVSMPKEDREKILSQYVSNVNEKDKERAEITLRWAVNKLVEEEAAERERSVTEAQRGHEEKRSVKWADMLDEGEEVEEGETAERQENEENRREMSEQQQEEQEEQQEEESKRRQQEEQQEEERIRRRQ